MLVGVALVAEVLRELVHLLEAADDEPLEIQLVGDAEVEILAEQVRRRDERLGEPAAVARVAVDAPLLPGVAKKLDAPGAIEEMEEDELPHAPPSEHPPGEPPLRLRGDAVLERLRLEANRSNLVSVAKVLRRRHRRESTARNARAAYP